MFCVSLPSSSRFVLPSWVAGHRYESSIRGSCESNTTDKRKQYRNHVRHCSIDLFITTNDWQWPWPINERTSIVLWKKSRRSITPPPQQPQQRNNFFHTTSPPGIEWSLTWHTSQQPEQLLSKIKKKSKTNLLQKLHNEMASPLSNRQYCAHSLLGRVGSVVKIASQTQQPRSEAYLWRGLKVLCGDQVHWLWSPTAWWGTANRNSQ